MLFFLQDTGRILLLILLNVVLFIKISWPTKSGGNACIIETCGLTAVHHSWPLICLVYRGIFSVSNVLPAQCEHGCKHGECVGPNKCKCFPGYTGKTCNQGGYSRSVRKGMGNIGLTGFNLLKYIIFPHQFWMFKLRCKCGPFGFWFFLDLNECGLKPRPCEHRCMNTHGSYKCYCLNGYMLMSDGSCASEFLSSLSCTITSNVK